MSIVYIVFGLQIRREKKGRKGRGGVRKKSTLYLFRREGKGTERKMSVFATNISKSSSSSSYSVYSAHRKLWSGSGEGRKTAAHTHRGEYGQRVLQLDKGL